MKRPIYYLLTLSYLLLTSFGSSLFAINPVTTVWRADTRDPDEIFRDGFRPWGDNTSLLEHTLGVSVSMELDVNPEASSIFISTSANTDTNGREAYFTRDVLDAIYTFSPPSEIWVYDINPDTNFYNSEAYLRAFLESPEGQILSKNKRGEIIEVIQIAVEQNEWVALGLIAPERIRGARLWSSGTGELDRDRDPIVNWQPTDIYLPNDSTNNPIPNNRYDGRELRSNSNPYPNILGGNIPNETNILVTESASGSYGSAGFCMEGVAGSSFMSTSHREKRDTGEKKYCRLVNPREEMIKKLMPILSFPLQEDQIHSLWVRWKKNLGDAGWHSWDVFKKIYFTLYP